jgi:alanyl-tRNA synthetase
MSMKTDEIRARFIEFFQSKGHRHLPSDTLVPTDDPSVLFTGAGMNQFKHEFYGRSSRGLKRAVTCQKCLRTGDIENVGRTAGHHTFFEMLGNFSFGDYFKRESIQWAWEFMLETLGVPGQHLVVTIYRDDEEAFEIWRESVGLNEDIIYRYDEDENFWPANARTQGPDGPCGPCSEIHYDYGRDRGCGRPDCGPSCSCGRFVEVWNLVFQQYDRRPDATLAPLPMRNIDTGMGLERMARVLQGVPTNFDIDLFAPLMKRIGEIAGKPYGPDVAYAPYMRRIADHARAVSFCITDGVVPSNEERGYVVRRLLRRAVRDGVQLGITEPFMAGLVVEIVEGWQTVYPELAQARKHVETVIGREEATFQQTVQRGSNRLDQLIADLKRGRQMVLRGEEAFDLYQTYGFPVEMTQSILAEQGLSVDMQGFVEAMQRHIDVSRTGARFSGQVFDQGPVAQLKERVHPTEFTGYQTLESQSRVVGVVVDGQLVDSISGGQEGVLILERTPAYAEAGGQVGDAGLVRALEGEGKKPSFLFEFTDTTREGGFHLHHGKADTGSVSVGDEVDVRVDEERRRATMRNHTATHLLHFALKEVLGEHANQAGSWVGPDRLRFDFTHPSGLTDADVRSIEDIVNRRILDNEAVWATQMSLDEARRAGAMALFGEKYGDVVRVLSVGSFSKELCGGTHCRSTGEVGAFRIVSESSVAGGVRRIEAVTGSAVIERLREKEDLLGAAAARLNTPEANLLRRIDEVVAEAKSLQKALKKERRAAVQRMAGETLSDAAEEIGGVSVVVQQLDGDMGALRSAADSLKRGRDDVAVLLASVQGKKVALVCSLAPGVVKRGLNAGDIVGQVAAVVGGGGGGRADMAQAGGRDVDKVDAALEKAREIFRNALGG